MYKKKKKKARGYLIRVERKGGYKYGMDREEEEDVTSFSLSLVCNQLRVASILKRESCLLVQVRERARHSRGRATWKKCRIDRQSLRIRPLKFSSKHMQIGRRRRRRRKSLERLGANEIKKNLSLDKKEYKNCALPFQLVVECFIDGAQSDTWPAHISPALRVPASTTSNFFLFLKRLTLRTDLYLLQW